MGEYKPSEYYDQTYKDNPKYTCEYYDSPYYELWKNCITKIDFDKNILEVGCGTGQFKQMLHKYGFSKNYLGFDFSKEAIEICNDPRCYVGDARSIEFYLKQIPTEQIICMEVLEHLQDDIEVIRIWEKGTPFLITVPCFDDPAHVRWFNEESEIRHRYEIQYNCLRIDSIEKFDRWFILTGITK